MGDPEKSRRAMECPGDPEGYWDYGTLWKNLEDSSRSWKVFDDPCYYRAILNNPLPLPLMLCDPRESLDTQKYSEKNKSWKNPERIFYGAILNTLKPLQSLKLIKNLAGSSKSSLWIWESLQIPTHWWRILKNPPPLERIPHTSQVCFKNPDPCLHLQAILQSISRIRKDLWNP